MREEQYGLLRLLNRRIEIQPKHVHYFRNVSISLLASLVLLAVYGAGCFDSTRTKVDERIAWLKLAPLPPSATNIAYRQWSGLFTGEIYIKIQMATNDLAAFIANSPGLAQGKVEFFTRDRQHLPRPAQQSASLEPGPSYFSRHSQFPQWFDLTITNAGRRYEIWPNKRIYINEETATVYLHLIKG